MRCSVQALTAICVMFAACRLSAEAPLPIAENVSRNPDLAAALPWQPAAPRTEICPAFSFDPKGGPRHDGAWTITADARRGLHGCWRRTFDVKGGDYYQFTSLPGRRACRCRGGAPGCASCGRTTTAMRRRTTGRWRRATWLAGRRWRSQFPTDKPVRGDGWTEVSDVYRVPGRATRAVVELNLQWASQGAWSGASVSLTPTAAPRRRKVRLAAVHYRPTGKSPAENCREYEPFIAEAARQKADLVVLGETITLVGLKRPKYEDIAEPVPGPSTEYFGSLGETSQPAHRRRFVQARRARDLQRRRAAGAGWNAVGQVP